jgi:hypothetical protein
MFFQVTDCHKLALDDVHFLREVANGASDF